MIFFLYMLFVFYKYSGPVAPRLSLCIRSVCIWLGLLCVPRSTSAHRAPGKKATAPIYKVLERPGRRVEFSTFQQERRMHLPLDHGLVFQTITPMTNPAQKL